MHPGDYLQGRGGLSIPYEWWPSAPMLKEIEASGLAWVQLPSPPGDVLSDPRSAIRHARGVSASLRSTRLRSVLHAPGNLLAGTARDDRALAGALSYAAECGAEQVVIHARNLPDGAEHEDRRLAETRSLARLVPLAERLGVVMALENLAPVFPGPEVTSANPLAIRALVRRLSSPAVGMCLDVGHANVIAGLRRTSLTRMIEPVLDVVSLFHLHDNLGARWRGGDQRPELDPLRLDLHLAPGRGSIDWTEITPALLDHEAPLLLEIHPPRATPEELLGDLMRELSRRPAPRSSGVTSAPRGAPDVAAPRGPSS